MPSLPKVIDAVEYNTLPSPTSKEFASASSLATRKLKHPNTIIMAPTNGANQSNIPNNDPTDQTLTSCILFEPPIPQGNISESGLYHIANHKYVSGSYTVLDNALNPLWTSLTNALPLWLAPNMVTTLGGLHCGVGYGLLWWYSPDFDKSPPDWVVWLCGYCTFAYYTLDCMDGKQARRTGSSSPLGQLL